MSLYFLMEKTRVSDPKNFVLCKFEDLEENDIVSSFTITYAQKYLIMEGYEEYNMFKYGILIYKNKEDPEKSILLTYDTNTKEFYTSNLYKNPGTSGSFYLKKCVMNS